MNGLATFDRADFVTTLLQFIWEKLGVVQINVEITSLNQFTNAIRFRFTFDTEAGLVDDITSAITNDLLTSSLMTHIDITSKHMVVLPACSATQSCSSHGVSMRDYDGSSCICSCEQFWISADCSQCSPMMDATCSVCKNNASNPPVCTPDGTHNITYSFAEVSTGTIDFGMAVGIAVGVVTAVTITVLTCVFKRKIDQHMPPSKSIDGARESRKSNDARRVERKRRGQTRGHKEDSEADAVPTVRLPSNAFLPGTVLQHPQKLDL
jgi:hypothetical protein